MDRFREMAHFVAVVEAGSFVPRRKGLRLSKAAVSRNVIEPREPSRRTLAAANHPETVAH